MRKFYMVSSIVVAVMILVMAFTEFGSSCSFLLFNSSSYVTFPLLQMAGMGAILGGLLVLFWKMPPPEKDDEDTEIDKTGKPNTKIDE